MKYEKLDRKKQNQFEKYTAGLCGIEIGKSKTGALLIRIPLHSKMTDEIIEEFKKPKS